MSNNTELAVKEGFPISESGSSWIFGSNLIKYLDGSFKLVFLPNNPVEELKDGSMGCIRLQTKDGINFLFVISNVRHDRFEQLAQPFEKEAKEKTYTIDEVKLCIQIRSQMVYLTDNWYVITSLETRRTFEEAIKKAENEFPDELKDQRFYQLLQKMKDILKN